MNAIRLLALMLAADGGSPYSIEAEIDGVLTAGVWSLALLAGQVSSDLPGGRQCKETLETGACDPSVLNAIDRTVVGNRSEGWETFSDIGLYGGLLLPFALAGIDANRAHEDGRLRGYGRDSLVIAQAIGINAALTAVGKAAFRRSRPTHYRAHAELERVQERFSFPSGHTSVTAAGMTAWATTFALRHPTSRWRYAAASSALLWTAATGYGRVAAGRHFYTDVLAGAVLGGMVGFLVPKLHETNRSEYTPQDESTGGFVLSLGGTL